MKLFMDSEIIYLCSDTSGVFAKSLKFGEDTIDEHL